MEKRFESPLGTFSLNRNRGETNRSLRAWSSADSYILDNLNDYDLDDGAKILIFNDSFGALSIPLSLRFSIFCCTDSFCSEKVIRENLELNNLKADRVSFPGPEEDLPADADLIIIKNPKSLNYLEYELQNISSSYKPGVPVIAGDMAKNIHSSTVSLFEHYLKDVKTSLAWKKARLLRGITDGRKEMLNSFPVEYNPGGFPYSVVNFPNLFAFGRLDPGSAFMINNFPEPAVKPEKIIDLACGDGILALNAARLWPESKILCVDESHLAVRSARESFVRNGQELRAEFRVTDVLEGVDRDSADLILCNPPFHDSHSLSTSTAMKMFSQSYDVLKRGGELFVIANRHLGYEKTLGKIYASVSICSASRKFSVLKCVK